ncbi:hypothetical protein GGS20DRAFT_568499 [Poronia punctata]|nr:hypothetical protein GGS20DRAFT_568499 [Poronia punctata]
MFLYEGDAEERLYKFVTPKISRFIPARNSKHRVACLALYRALLRLAKHVSLPDRLANGWGPGKNPVAIHVERAFRRNINDVSPRLVYPALQAGYRMVSVLHVASTTPSSKQHSSIVSFLEEQLGRRKRSQAHPPPIRPPRTRPSTTPLLVKIPPPSTPGKPSPPATFITPERPRPASQLGGSGIRHVPVLVARPEYSFVRFKKPQPVSLSMWIRKKLKTQVGLGDALVHMATVWRPVAEDEDMWDLNMERLAQGLEPKPLPPPSSEERVKGHQDTGYAGIQKSILTSLDEDFLPELSLPDLDTDTDTDTDTDAGQDADTYAHFVDKYGLAQLWNNMSKLRLEQIERTAALRRLVQKERALAEAEEACRDPEKWPAWNEKMTKLHGENWRELFPGLEEPKSKPKPKLSAAEEDGSDGTSNDELQTSKKRRS